MMIDNLKKSFGQLKERLEQQEIILFYKINTEFESLFSIADDTTMSNWLLFIH